MQNIGRYDNPPRKGIGKHKQELTYQGLALQLIEALDQAPTSDGPDS